MYRVKLLLGFTLVCVLFSVFALYKIDKELKKQTLVICIWTMVLTIPAYQYLPGLLRSGQVGILLALSLLIIASWLGTILGLTRNEGYLCKCIKQIDYKASLYFFALIFGLLCLSHEEKTFYMWDCHNMISHLEEINSIEALFDLPALSFFDHISYSYMAVAILFKLICGSATIGQSLYAKTLLMVGTYGYWKLIRYLYNGRREVEYFLLTLMFSGSPFLLGMVTYSYNDYATWCIFPILLYFLLSGKYVYTLLTSLYFVFCKESCIISYSFLLLGLYITEMLEEKRIIHHVLRYSVLLLPCFLWLIAYFWIGHWQGGGGLILNFEYVITKLKSFFFISFNWLIAFIGFIGFCISLYKVEYRRYRKFLFPVFFSAVAYVFFSIIIDTKVNHPRYVDALLSQLYILASFFPMVVLSQNVIRVLYSLTGSVIMLVASFATIDPVSRMVFPVISVGTSEVVSTGEPLCDGWVYNREYQQYGYIMDMALEDICKDPLNHIYFPAYYDDTWHFDAMGYYSVMGNDTEKVLSEEWNEMTATRMVDPSDENIEFNVHVITASHTIELPDDGTGYLFFTDYAGQNIANKISSQFEVIMKEDFTRKGWTMHRIMFVKNKQ